MIKYFVMSNFVFLTSVSLIIANVTAAKCLLLLQCYIKQVFCIKFWHVHACIIFVLIHTSLAIEPQTFRTDSVTSFTVLSTACPLQENQRKSITGPTFLFGSVSDIFFINSFSESLKTYCNKGVHLRPFQVMKSC